MLAFTSLSTGTDLHFTYQPYMLLHLKQAQTSYNTETHWNPTVKDKLSFQKQTKSEKEELMILKVI